MTFVLKTLDSFRSSVFFVLFCCFGVVCKLISFMWQIYITYSGAKFHSKLLSVFTKQPPLPHTHIHYSLSAISFSLTLCISVCVVELCMASLCLYVDSNIANKTYCIFRETFTWQFNVTKMIQLVFFLLHSFV